MSISSQSAQSTGVPPLALEMTPRRQCSHMTDCCAACRAAAKAVIGAGRGCARGCACRPGRHDWCPGHPWGQRTVGKLPSLDPSGAPCFDALEMQCKHIIVPSSSRVSCVYIFMSSPSPFWVAALHRQTYSSALALRGHGCTESSEYDTHGMQDHGQPAAQPRDQQL